jgi:pimeloyl-ACP methyl ester carboxylesterase
MAWFIRGVLILIGLVVVLGAAAYFVLRRPDVPYDTLAVRYESAASRYVELPSGVRMHYRDEGNADGPVIVLVHGFSSSLHTWEPWVQRLGADYRVISLDLPGHGLTRGPAGYAPSISAFRDEVAALAAELELTRFAIGGNSMGGHVAWEYALAHPTQIDALILVDSAGWASHAGGSDSEPIVFKLLRNPIARPIMRDLDNTALVRQGLQASFGDGALATEEMVQRYVDFTRAPGHRDILLEMGTGGRDPATPERLAPLANLPVLILHGDTDRLIALDSSERFRDAISGSELITFAGVGHLPQEEAADASAQAVREFLYRVHEGPALATAAQ